MGVIRSFIDLLVYPFRMLATIPSNVISSPRRMLGLPLPSRVALLLFICLVAIAITRWVIFWQLDELEQFGPFLRSDVLPIVVLVLLIPCLVWYALKLWLEGEPSPFQDIDDVWEKALTAMREQSIVPLETPIFFILGPAGASRISEFMNATNQRFSVRVPAGDGPLHVFANTQGIYIVCGKSCQLGRLLDTDRAKGAGAGGDFRGVEPARKGFDPSKTMEVSVFDQTDDRTRTATGYPASVKPFGLRGTQTAAQQNEPHGTATPSAGIENRGTMMVDHLRATAEPAEMIRNLSAGPRLAVADAIDASERLKYLCRVIRRIREPLCPINGILVATPFEILCDGSESVVGELQAAISADTAAIRETTRVRCSVTHLVHAMDKEAGFREFVRRIGPARASSQRIGKGFGVWNMASPDQLELVVRHACWSFESWSYLLFREEDGLSRRGNRHLFGLLCRIRADFQSRLKHLIRSSYAVEPNANSVAKREPLLFSGCYFAATGETAEHQAFLASVFDKTRELEEEVEWGSEAIEEENRMQFIVRILLVANGILFATIAALLIYYFNFRSEGAS